MGKVPGPGLIAGLGAGGFAVALAARSTVENLFGGEKKLGPSCSRRGDLDGTLTSRPSADLVALRIANCTERGHCLCVHRFGLRYEAMQHQPQALIAGIGRMPADHPMAERAGGMARVQLVGSGDTALAREVRATILVASWPVSVDGQQGLRFGIMGLVDGYGSRLATRTRAVPFGARSRPVGACGPHTPPAGHAGEHGWQATVRTLDAGGGGGDPSGRWCSDHPAWACSGALVSAPCQHRAGTEARRGTQW